MYMYIVLLHLNQSKLFVTMKFLIADKNLSEETLRFYNRGEWGGRARAKKFHDLDRALRIADLIGPVRVFGELTNGSLREVRREFNGSNYRPGR